LEVWKAPFKPNWEKEIYPNRRINPSDFPGLGSTLAQCLGVNLS